MIETNMSDPEYGYNQTNSNWTNWLNKPAFALLLILAALLAAYAQSVDAPFYMDDFSSIQENPRIYNSPDRSLSENLSALWNYSPLRIVGYLSFVLNYQYDHFNTTSYHWVNISIHFLMSLSLFFLLRGLLLSPRLQKYNTPIIFASLPLFAALIFALHPLHTQAVTYIVQRLASLAALFYVASMTSFVFARLAEQHSQRNLWLLACALFALLALFTKQNAFTLPLALLLLEALFFSRNARRLLHISLGVLVGLIIIWAILAFGFQYQPFSLQAMQALSRETSGISRIDYLATQMPVIWTYIRLFFFPTDLHLDYELLPLTGFADTHVMIALAGHLLLLGLAVFLFRRLPLVAFAILFYYLAHSVESSLIPIRDVIFEHRSYLPDVGLSVLLAWFIVSLLGKWLHQQTVIMLGLILVLILGYTTWQRNQVWRDPIKLWRSNTEIEPNKARAWSILGKHLLQAQQPKEGIKALKTSLEIQQRSQGTSINTVDIVNLIVGLKMLKKYDQALALTENVLKQPIQAHLKAKFMINRSNIFYEQKRYDEAEVSLREAIAVYPDSITARANLASIVGTLGRLDEAEALYNEVLRIDPHNQVIQRNLQALQELKQKQAGQ